MANLHFERLFCVCVCIHMYVFKWLNLISLSEIKFSPQWNAIYIFLNPYRHFSKITIIESGLIIPWFLLRFSSLICFFQYSCIFHVFFIKWFSSRAILWLSLSLFSFFRIRARRVLEGERENLLTPERQHCLILSNFSPSHNFHRDFA